MKAMLTMIALFERITPESIATHCSVKARGEKDNVGFSLVTYHNL